MLQAIRGRVASWIVKILFVLLIISFGAWGIADYINSSKAPGPVVTVDGVEITRTEISAELNREAERLRSVLGTVDREQMKQLGLYDQAIDRLVTRLLIEREAVRLGISVNDTMVAQQIRDNPAFRNETGQFDRERFIQLIARLGYSEAGFVQEFRRDMVRSQLVGSIEGGATSPKILAEALARHRGERRVAETLSLAMTSLPATPAPTDAQIEEQYKANAARYMAPERRSASILSLTPADLAGDVAVSDEELKEAFKARAAELGDPEKRTVDQILVGSEADAKAIAEKIAAGTPFDKAAEGVGQFTAMGEIGREELPPELADPVFSLPEGQVGAPVQSGFGWHLFRVSAIKPARMPEFDAVKDRLKADLVQERALDLVYDRSNKLDQMLSTKMQLDEAAKQTGAKIIAVTSIDQQGNPALGAAPVPLPGAAQTLAAIFGQAVGETGRLVELPDGGFVAVRVDGIIPSAQRPLAEVRDQVITDWTAAQREQAGRAKADEIAAAIRSGKPMAEVATGLGQQVQTTEPFGRDANGTAPLPPGVMGELFEAKEPGVVSVGRTADGFVIARLKEIRPVDTADEATTVQINRAIGQALSSELFDQFQQSLRSRYPVVIDRKALDTLL